MANFTDTIYLADIANEMALSAAKRGTGIAIRTPQYLLRKIQQGLALIAVDPTNNQWIGFCYLEVWSNIKYIANSGLIIASEYRGLGYSRDLKEAVFEYSCQKFPFATLFSLTSNAAVKRINIDMGYREVTFDRLLQDVDFMSGMASWVDYVGLMNSPELSAKYVALIYERQPSLVEANGREYLPLHCCV